MSKDMGGAMPQERPGLALPSGVEPASAVSSKAAIPIAWHDRLWAACQKLPGDYDPWGSVERWADPQQSYPDCSHGCHWALELRGRNGERLGLDWCVCANEQSHRYGLLTFEHQGCQKFERRRRERRAQGIEARRAETALAGSVHESPVGAADAPEEPLVLGESPTPKGMRPDDTLPRAEG